MTLDELCPSVYPSIKQDYKIPPLLPRAGQKSFPITRVVYRRGRCAFSFVITHHPAVPEQWLAASLLPDLQHQPGPGETPMSERIYENTQHSGMGQPARLAPPGAPSAPTEVCLGSPDGTGQSHIYSQPKNMGKVPQGDPDEVHYSAVQLQPPTRRAEPEADLTCEYAAIKR
ncbi:hypothetical protein DR999_PMT22000 [Platysternon megacephalum]|uniref:Uncharacterized protein n=1 Tax=Platysternon megacephalum TaxID=55544 RepID=A0A4D9DGY4_9SAUR|nr:hypothetical protein DR999_PMT22000 [Platysternon megacephalum]